MRPKRKPPRREVYSKTTSFDDSSEITVWFVNNLEQVNGALRNLPVTGSKSIHVIPIPAGAEVSEEIFLPGNTALDRGFECPACKHRIQGGIGQKVPVQHFDYCRCILVIRPAESTWNEILLGPDG